jgi:thioredoxin 1
MSKGIFATGFVAVVLAALPMNAQTADQIAARKAAKQPVVTVKDAKHIYPEIAQAPLDVKAALAEARRTHKRILLDFGGDWCGDCQVLNIYFHQSPNKELLEKYFVLVDVNIGKEDANLDIAHKYGVPVQGVPALAVLDEHGKAIYSQNKEFSDMRYMDVASVTEFLNKWKK